MLWSFFSTIKDLKLSSRFSLCCFYLYFAACFTTIIVITIIVVIATNSIAINLLQPLFFRVLTSIISIIYVFNSKLICSIIYFFVLYLYVSTFLNTFTCMLYHAYQVDDIKPVPKYQNYIFEISIMSLYLQYIVQYHLSRMKSPYPIRTRYPIFKTL